MPGANRTWSGRFIVVHCMFQFLVLSLLFTLVWSVVLRLVGLAGFLWAQRHQSGYLWMGNKVKR